MKLLRLTGSTPPEWRARLSSARDYGLAVTCAQAASPVRSSSWVSGEKGGVNLMADPTGCFHSFSGWYLRPQQGRYPRDYDLPRQVRTGLPIWEEESAASDGLPLSLQALTFKSDPVAGDIVVDWSDGAWADAVLITPLEHDIWLCCHYQESTQRWVGLSLRNVPITIMNDSSLFGGEWAPRTSLQTAWRRLLRPQAAE
jgi:hypothetical protein